MRRLNVLLLLLMLILITFFATSCICTDSNHTSNNQNGADNDVMTLYTIDDFQSIIVGVSTYDDVYVIAPTITSMQITSYGGLCKYPARNGGEIVIKFCGEKLIVCDIIEMRTGNGSKPLKK